MTLHEQNRALEAKYAITGWLYDVLDYPWERQYRRWRPDLQEGVRGHVMEAGVGTGQNLRYHDHGVELLRIDLSATMLRKAAKRARTARCAVELRKELAGAGLERASHLYAVCLQRRLKSSVDSA